MSTRSGEGRGATRPDVTRDDDVVVHTGELDASGMRIGIVASWFNDEVVATLVDGAVGALTDHGAAEADIHLAWVPGAFDIPVALARMAATGTFDALVALGAVVRGETPHFDYVAGESAAGAGAVAREQRVPVAFGVLTTDTWEQAVERAGGRLGNKGAEAALAAVETANLLEAL